MNGPGSASVRFWLFGREFALRCDPGQEERLHFLVNRLKERLEALSVTMPPAQRSLPAQMELLVMAAVTFADEFQDAREALNRLQDAFRAGGGPTAPEEPAPHPQALHDMHQRHSALHMRLQQMETRLQSLAEGLAAPAADPALPAHPAPPDMQAVLETPADPE